MIAYEGLNLFDAKTNKNIYSIEPGHRVEVSGAAYLSETEILLSGYDIHTDFAAALEIFNTNTKKVVRTYDSVARARGPVAICLSPDRTHALLETRGTFLCLEIGSGEVLWELDRANAIDRYARHLDYSPDGRQIAAVGGAFKAFLLDANTGARRMFKNPGHDEPLWSFAVSRDAKLMASFSRTEIVVWNVETSEQLAAWECPPDFSINTGVWSPDNRRIYVVGSQNNDRLAILGFDVESHQLLLRTELPELSGVACAISKDGQRLAVGGPSWADKDANENFERLLAVLDANTGKVLHKLDRHSGAPPVEHLQFQPNEDLLVTAADSEWTVWDFDKNSIQRHKLPASVEWTSLAAESPRLAIQLNGHEVQILNTETGKQEATIQVSDESFSSTTISPDGKRLCVACYPVKVVNGIEDLIGLESKNRVWEVDSGILLDSFAEPGAVAGWRYQFSPDGETFFVGSFTGAVLAWDLPAPVRKK